MQTTSLPRPPHPSTTSCAPPSTAAHTPPGIALPPPHAATTSTHPAAATPPSPFSLPPRSHGWWERHEPAGGADGSGAAAYYWHSRSRTFRLSPPPPPASAVRVRQLERGDFDSKLLAVRRLVAGEVSARSGWRRYDSNNPNRRAGAPDQAGNASKRQRTCSSPCSRYVHLSTGRRSTERPPEGVQCIVAALTDNNGHSGDQEASFLPAVEPPQPHQQQSSGHRRILVLDTNSLLANEQFAAVCALRRRASLPPPPGCKAPEAASAMVMVPWAVQTELGGLSGYDVPDTEELPGVVGGEGGGGGTSSPDSWLARAAQRALAWLHHAGRGCGHSVRCQTRAEQHAADSCYQRQRRLSADDSILACCLWFQRSFTSTPSCSSNSEHVVLLSEDAVLAIKSIAHGVPCRAAAEQCARPATAAASYRDTTPPSPSPSPPPSDGGKPHVVALLDHTSLMHTDELVALNTLAAVGRSRCLTMVVPPATLSTLDKLKTEPGDTGFQARRAVHFVRTHLAEPWMVVHTNTCLSHLEHTIRPKRKTEIQAIMDAADAVPTQSKVLRSMGQCATAYTERLSPLSAIVVLTAAPATSHERMPCGQCSAQDLAAGGHDVLQPGPPQNTK
jgi:hypothetical protein